MSTPIIPWMGGKRRLADRLIPLFPPHECYVEVFAGGAALYFMRPQAAPVEILNDINGDLVTLYRVVQNHLEEFVRQFKWALSCRQVFEWQKMTRLETLTDIQRVARFFYLQHHAFAGKVTGQTLGTVTTGPAITPITCTEASTQSAAPACVQRPHELNVPSAKMRPSKTRTPNTGRPVFGNSGIGIPLTDSNGDIEGGRLAAYGH